jgi:hypothetical protein
MVLRTMSVYIDGDIKILYIVYTFFLFFIIFSSIPAKKKIEVCILKTLQPSKHIQNTQKKRNKKKKRGDIYWQYTVQQWIIDNLV